MKNVLFLNKLVVLLIVAATLSACREYEISFGRKVASDLEGGEAPIISDSLPEIETLDMRPVYSSWSNGACIDDTQRSQNRTWKCMNSSGRVLSESDCAGMALEPLQQVVTDFSCRSFSYSYSAWEDGECIDKEHRLQTRTRQCVNSRGGAVAESNCSNGAGLELQQSIEDVACGFCGGDGSASKPLRICTADQLNLISNRFYQKATQQKAHFVLANDLDMNASSISGSLSASNFMPLEWINAFDGNFKVIRNLRFMESTQTGAAFIQSVLESKSVSWAVRNLRFLNTIYKVGSGSSLGASGLLASGNLGKDVSDVDFDGLKIEVGSATNGIWIGGVIGGGNFSGTIRDVDISNLHIKASDADNGITVGGLWGGGNGAKISNCRVSGLIEVGHSGNSLWMGGLAGGVNGGRDATIQNSYANVRMTHRGSDNGVSLGAIVGGGIGEVQSCTYNASAVPGLGVAGGGIITVTSSGPSP